VDTSPLSICETRATDTPIRSATCSWVIPRRALETVADTLRLWLDRGLDRKKIRSQNTIDGLTWAVEKQLIPAIGAYRLRDLECEHVEDMLAGMAADGMSSSSLTRIHTTLTRALKWAQRRGKVYRNVSDLVETPVGTHRPSQALTVDQVQAVLDTAKDDRLEALWTLGLILGMRPGELAGLRWEDVDFDTGVISVMQSLKHSRGTLWQGDTKTRQSRRRFKALPVTLAALKSHRARQAAEKLKAGEVWTDTGLVFTTEIGTPIDPANLRRAFRALIKAAGVPDKQPTEECPKPGHWHPHEMRHSAGSYMDHMGVPPKRIASILGHDGTRTTETVYIHGQEVIDMTGDEFETYGNQFGNQSAEGS
jgi:integrase